ncbi:MAG: hypothetical protein ACLPRE_09220 [Limisphaerales bacterium]
MIVRLGKWVVVAMLVVSTGIHWVALQTVAWAGMIVSYSEKAPLKTALAETFDGKHPCPLCRAIAAAKKSEKKNEFTLQTQKLEFPPAKENPVLIAPSDFQLLPQANFFADSLMQKPPTPPPRGFFV